METKKTVNGNQKVMLATEKNDHISATGKLIEVEHFACVDYQTAFNAMRDYSDKRDDTSADKIWLLEHPSVYTQGTACHQQTLFPSDIPVVKTDRGGQITYHGQGQLVMYPLLKLRRFGVGVKALVNALEQSVIDTLETYHIDARRRADAPGVYVDHAKIAALGLRIRRGNSYHGLSLNVDMDLSPFKNIDPCGFQGLAVTQVQDHTKQTISKKVIAEQLLENFIAKI